MSGTPAGCGHRLLGMAASAGISVPDLVLYIGVVVGYVTALRVMIAVPGLVRWIGERFRKPEVVANGPPIEQLAADLRRVHRALLQLGRGTTIVRWRATRQAYDILLVQACAA